MNYLYAICLKDLSWSKLVKYSNVIPLLEQQKINQLRFDDDKLRSLIGKLLLFYVLKKHQHDQTNKLPDICYYQYAKPYLDGFVGGFNISHSGEWVVCLYSPYGAVGVDIEKIQPINIDEYRDVLTPAEYDAIENGLLDFMQLWTLKEAIIKADGRGFYLAPNSFDIPLPFENHVKLHLADHTWFIALFDFSTDYKLAIASITDTRQTTIQTVGIESLIQKLS